MGQCGAEVLLLGVGTSIEALGRPFFVRGVIPALRSCGREPRGRHDGIGRALADDWRTTAGWDLLAHLATSDTTLPDACLGEYIEPIDAHIQTSKNHVRHSMNGALIAMGIRNPKLQRQAIAAAKRIGRVDVDHGPTSCQTPDAVAYIERAVQHRQRKSK